MEFLTAFGVSWKSLLAQFVNFAVLMAILHKVAYKPMLRFMKDRTERIAKGLEDAKAAERALLATREEQERVLVEARQQAKGIVESARLEADKQASAMIVQAKGEVAQIVSEGKKVLQTEREKIIAKAKEDVIRLVIAGTEKILTGVVDETLDKTWIKTRIQKLR